MDLQEMQKQLQKLKNEQQDKFIDNLKEMVVNLCEKANKRDYQPTTHERETFEEVRTILNNMADWF